MKPGRKCGWIRVYTGPEMRTRQEMVPKTELEFNDVRMNERIGGGSYNIKKSSREIPANKHI